MRTSDPARLGFALLALLGGATGARAQAGDHVTEPAPAKEIQQVVLDARHVNRVHIVKVAPRYPVTVEFDEPYEEPIRCGDCNGKDSLFRLDAFPEQHSFTIKVIKNVGPQSNGSTLVIDDFVTNVGVRLESGKTISLQVEGVADARQATERVQFASPGGGVEAAHLKEQLDAEREKLESEFASRVEQSATHAFVRAIAEPHECRSTSARTRRDDILLELKEVCRFFGRVFVRLEIENRGRSSFAVGDVRVRASANGEPQLVQMLGQNLLTRPRLDFQQTSTVVVTLKDDAAAALTRFEATVSESGGTGREVTTSNF
jgi:hypothetical protein